MNINVISGILREKRDASFTYGQKEINKCEALIGIDKLKKNGDVWYTEEMIISIEFMGKMADSFNDDINIGAYVAVQYDINCTEKDGRYFTSLRGKKYELVGKSTPASNNSVSDNNADDLDDDDLPF